MKKSPKENRIQPFRIGPLGLLALIWLLVAPGAIAETKPDISAGAPIWPLPDRTDFSSGFGDFRPGRFHYGLDLRTGDKRLPVVAPVSGFVSQVWLSYFGYGKALYLKGDDGSTYVFAHLDHYIPEIDSVVKALQFTSKRYYQRKWFEPEEFPVKQGDTIAFSGKTGIGAPHLHFESRDRENVPRSPLRRGFAIRDTQGPQFSALTFEYLDRKSVFTNGRRRIKVNAEQTGADASGARHFSLESAPYFSAEFGVIAHVRDYPTNKKFATSPHRLKLSYVGPLPFDTIGSAGEPHSVDAYNVTLDSLSYSEGELAFCIYEQGLAANGDKNGYLLFQRENVADCFSDRGGGSAGRFPFALADSALTEFDGMRYGVYRGRVEAYDASGAPSFLDFRFCYGPPGDLFFVTDYSADRIFVSMQRPELFKGFMRHTRLRVGEVNSDGDWRELPGAKIEKVADDTYRISFTEKDRPQRGALLRLKLSGIEGWSKLDVYLTQRPQREGFAVDLSYLLGDGGLYVDATVNQTVTRAPNLRAELAGGASLNLSALQVAPEVFRAFIPADSLRPPVVALEAFASERSGENSDSETRINGLYVAALSGVAAERYSVRTMSDAKVFLPRDGLKAPRMIELVEVRDTRRLLPQKSSIVAGLYQLGPQDFRFDQDVRLGISPNTFQEPGVNIAICKLNKKEDGWSWIDTEYEAGASAAENGTFWAEINSPGVYALCRDTEAPAVSKVTVRRQRGKTVLTLKVTDELSAIWSDTLFDAQVNGQWLIPEYDAEDEVLKLEAPRSFGAGNYELAFTVTDNAGNRARRTLPFRVKSK